MSVDTSNLELQVGIEVIGSYKRLSYTAWYAFAEFVDNSTQAYFNERELLEPALKKEGKKLTVTLTYDKGLGQIRISDNSIGMDREELAAALHIGIPPKNDKGRSKYGLGLKTAACWFGNKWTLKTSKLGEPYGVKVIVDVEDISKNKRQILPTTNYPEDKDAHYTEIVIEALNRQFHGKTLNKVKEFLTSMYRMDFVDPGLILTWQGSDLQWEGFDKRLYITQDGKPYKRPIEFSIGEPPKKINGWVGVLGKGSRKDAGFSIIQNNRVIKGWPDAYRPSSLFGDQESGTNNLVNQRLLGELFVDPKFAVSHTKDSILWQDNEEEELEKALEELCADAKVLAENLRVKGTVVEKTEAIKLEALTVFESELKSNEIRDRLFTDIIPEEEAIQLSYKRLIEAAQKTDSPSIEVEIGSDHEKIAVKVFLRATSEFEPYVLIETSSSKNTILVIINTLHPYWQELMNLDGFLSYIRHCVYDGLAEWRASRKTGRISHDTIKYIKDLLLRLPFDITNNSFKAFINPDSE